MSFRGLLFSTILKVHFLTFNKVESESFYVLYYYFSKEWVLLQPLHNCVRSTFTETIIRSYYIHGIRASFVLQITPGTIVLGK